MPGETRRRSRNSLRKKPKQERSASTVAAIVEAAAQVLLEQGYARASTNRIAARAGVSVGSLYQYFPDKTVLYEEVLERYLEALVDAVRGVDGDGPLETIIEDIVLRTLAVRADGPELLRRLQASGVPDFHGRLSRAKEDLAHFVTRLLAARRTGLPATELELRVLLALDASEGLLLQGAPRLPPARFAAELTRMLGPYIVAPVRPG